MIAVNKQQQPTLTHTRQLVLGFQSCASNTKLAYTHGQPCV